MPSWNLTVRGVLLAGMLVPLLREAPAPAQADAAQAKLQAVSFDSLLREMADYDTLARLPSPQYQLLQASSYNRESVRRGQPGWFADSDGQGFIRTEEVNGKTEWVIMEHSGPGSIVRIWTPFFYYSFEERKGPNLKIYLDGSSEAVINAPLIDLVTGRSFVGPPFASFTARAGVIYLPIPFQRGCRITLDQKPFYYTIAYRVYSPGTPVRTFKRSDYDKTRSTRDAVRRSLLDLLPAEGQRLGKTGVVGRSDSIALSQKGKGGAIRELNVRLDPEAVAGNPGLLRSVVLVVTLDGEQTIWSPVGDYFCSPNAVNSFRTWTRSVAANGSMTSRWVMPFRKDMDLQLMNLADQPIKAEISARVGRWVWDSRSMHFHANWRSDDIVAGTPFVDWNFIDIVGKGVLAGDSLTVLSPGRTWWGEGDEKIYVDGAYDEGFPTHFGTGTEDYYGWAGGRIPDKKDVFSIPYGANVAVGSTAENNPRGFNVCTRVRALDAVPFERRLVFDLEASPGVDIRNRWNLLGYSAVVYWYALPGASSNRPPLPAEAAKPIMSLENLDRREEELRRIR